jgi:hypothetical protein
VVNEDDDRAINKVKESVSNRADFPICSPDRPIRSPSEIYEKRLLGLKSIHYPESVRLQS